MVIVAIFVFEDLTTVPFYKEKYSRDVPKAHAGLISLKNILKPRGVIFEKRFRTALVYGKLCMSVK